MLKLNPRVMRPQEPGAFRELILDAHSSGNSVYSVFCFQASLNILVRGWSFPAMRMIRERGSMFSELKVKMKRVSRPSAQQENAQYRKS
jgi:hypothetical protein